MDRPDVDGRTVALAAVVVVGIVAGTVVLLSGEEARPVDTVPRADTVAVVDGDLIAHPTTERLANATLARSGTDVRYDELLAAVERQVGLRPERVEWVVAFARYPNGTAVSADPGQGYAGLVVRADWDERTLVSSVQESDLNLQRGSYDGLPVYRLDRSGPLPDVYVGVIGSDTYAVSTRRAVVEDAIDVRQNDRPGLSEGLRVALDDQREDSVVRVVARVPAERIESVAGDEAGRLTGLDRVALGYSAVNETHVGVRATMYAEDETAAEDLSELLSAARVLVGSRVEDDAVVAALDRVTVERSGSSVSLSYRDDVDDVIAAGDGLAALLEAAVRERTPFRLSPSSTDGGAVLLSERPATVTVVTVNSAPREGRTCATC